MAATFWASADAGSEIQGVAMTEFEVRAMQRLDSLKRAAWTIAWLVGIGLVLSLFSVSPSDYYEDEELDVRYADGPR